MLLRRGRRLQRQRKQARQRQVRAWKPNHGLQPLQADVEQATSEREKLFNWSFSDASSGEAGPHFTYQSLSLATDKFETRLGG